MALCLFWFQDQAVTFSGTMWQYLQTQQKLGELCLLLCSSLPEPQYSLEEYQRREFLSVGLFTLSILGSNKEINKTNTSWLALLYLSTSVCYKLSVVALLSCARVAGAAWPPECCCPAWHVWSDTHCFVFLANLLCIPGRWREKESVCFSSMWGWI